MAQRRDRVSIHAPARGATVRSSRNSSFSGFQSTPPARGATFRSWSLSDRRSFNPRPRAGGDGRQRLRQDAELAVSIHAPRAGGDDSGHVVPDAARRFNPRPRAGGDGVTRQQAATAAWFQSTPPARGATRACAIRRGCVVSIHAPRAGGDGARLPVFEAARVSIHAPRAGGDCGVGNLLHHNNIPTILREPCVDGKGSRQRVSLTPG